MRHELKYIITPVQYHLLKNRLKAVMQPDSHAGENGEYFIRSIYFDTPDYNAFMEKLSGIDSRKKYRIRFYNGEYSKCALECKEKKGTRINKTAEMLSEEQTAFLLSPDRMFSGKGTDGLGEMAIRICSLGFVPAVTVDYVREAYVLPVSNLRITFDKSVASGGVRDCLIYPQLMPNIMGDDMVLEVKYDDFIPEHISRIVSSINPVQTAASKYVMCLEHRFNTFS